MLEDNDHETGVGAYRWNPDAGKQPRGWYIEVAEAQRENEERFLKSEIYGRDLPLKSSLRAWICSGFMKLLPYLRGPT